MRTRTVRLTPAFASSTCCRVCSRSLVAAAALSASSLRSLSSFIRACRSEASVTLLATAAISAEPLARGEKRSSAGAPSPPSSPPDSGLGALAASCVGVDSSAFALELAARNAHLNGLDATCSFVQADVHKYLKPHAYASPPKRDGEGGGGAPPPLVDAGAYDVVICDPPKLAPSV